ncbi:VWA domain-containing protein [Acinetobacter variabilis]|uniref:vWA domain-containing protein n=1 Tax=Acinetobacter variabilis TaxID=70346 RepID=UPI003A87CFBC
MATYELTSSNELIDNPSPRCACMVILDTSGSMNGEAIRQLNSGIQHFIASVQEDEVAAYSVEISVITAGSSVTEILPFTTANNIEGIAEFYASGTTPLGNATELALKRLEERKKQYKRLGVAYYQPWLVIISDGAPTDSYAHVAQQAKILSEQRKLVVLPIGVDGADMNILNQFSSRGAKKLQGLKFNEFFEWLSASMSQVSASASTSSSIKLPSTDGWDSI